MLQEDFNIIFLGSSRCYHTMDWFRSAKKLNFKNPPLFITDLIEGEGFEKLIASSERIERLIILDKYLFKVQSRMGSLWRNILKLSLLPIQVFLLRRLLRAINKPTIHAHSMYYIMLARFSGAKYIATPQGSEILVRPFRSLFYKCFARIALSRASSITVDSESMQQNIFQLYGYSSKIVQNGIDVQNILPYLSNVSSITRTKLISVRGIAPNYRIEELVDARNSGCPSLPIFFCYPFIEKEYKLKIKNKLKNIDVDLGRLSREQMYELLHSAKLVISIPLSDSSPRSIYEAIFCGAVVAVSDSSWVKSIPSCMAQRVIVIDLDDNNWLASSIKTAEDILKVQYEPSEEALENYDQRKVIARIYASLENMH